MILTIFAFFHLYRYKCEYCTLDFAALFNLNCHVEKVHQGFKCYLCKKHFSSSTALNVHFETVHKDVTKHQCSECFDVDQIIQEFDKFSDLRKHILTCHNLLSAQVVTYSCDQCDEIFFKFELFNRYLIKSMPLKNMTVRSK